MSDPLLVTASVVQGAPLRDHGPNLLAGHARHEQVVLGVVHDHVACTGHRLDLEQLMRGREVLSMRQQRGEVVWESLHRDEITGDGEIYAIGAHPGRFVLGVGLSLARARVARAQIAFGVVLRLGERVGLVDLALPWTLVALGRDQDVLAEQRVVCSSGLSKIYN